MSSTSEYNTNEIFDENSFEIEPLIDFTVITLIEAQTNAKQAPYLDSDDESELVNESGRLSQTKRSKNENEVTIVEETVMNYNDDYNSIENFREFKTAKEANRKLSNRAGPCRMSYKHNWKAEMIFSIEETISARTIPLSSKNIPSALAFFNNIWENNKLFTHEIVPCGNLFLLDDEKDSFRHIDLYFPNEPQKLEIVNTLFKTKSPTVLSEKGNIFTAGKLILKLLGGQQENWKALTNEFLGSLDDNFYDWLRGKNHPKIENPSLEALVRRMTMRSEASRISIDELLAYKIKF